MKNRALTGLQRVREMSLNDGHLFVTQNQEFQRLQWPSCLRRLPANDIVPSLVTLQRSAHKVASLTLKCGKCSNYAPSCA